MLKSTKKCHLEFPEDNKQIRNQMIVIYSTNYYNRNKEKVLNYKKKYYTFNKQAKIFRNILLD